MSSSMFRCVSNSFRLSFRHPFRNPHFFQPLPTGLFGRRSLERSFWHICPSTLGFDAKWRHTRFRMSPDRQLRLWRQEGQPRTTSIAAEGTVDFTDKSGLEEMRQGVADQVRSTTDADTTCSREAHIPREDQAEEADPLPRPGGRPPDRLEPAIRVNFADGDVSIYAADGTWLACEDTFDDAMREAELVVDAWRNGAVWAQHEVEVAHGHLQKHFPEIAARYGL